MNKKLTRPTLTATRIAEPDGASSSAPADRSERAPRIASGPRARAVVDSTARRKREEAVTKADFIKTQSGGAKASFDRNFENKRATPAEPRTEGRSEGRAEGRFEGRRSTRGADGNTNHRVPPADTGANFRDKYKKPFAKPTDAEPLNAVAKPAFSKPRSARSPNSKDFRPALPRAVVASLAAMAPTKGVGEDEHAKEPHEDGTVRLSKLMSAQGIASRREADAWIAKGWVKVDGKVISELGSRILPTQKITIDRVAELEQQSRVTVLLNKPVGYVSGQAEDGHLPASVLFVAENRWEEDTDETEFYPMQAKGLAPAGRLDIDSVGLIVFTQDGRVAKQLIGDNSDVEKEYLVRVEGSLSASDLKLLNHGLSLDGQALRPATVEWQNEDQLRFVLREGKKRQIRRMCEMVGLTVVGLKRVRIGKIVLGNLPVGKWRYLAADESFG